MPAELVELRRRAVVALQPGGPLELVDHDLQRAVAIVGQALVAERPVALAGEPFLECQDDPRLADAGLAGEDRDLALAVVARLLPALAQERDLLLAADHRRQAGGAQRLEPADAARRDHAGQLDRTGEALELVLAQLLAVEQAADQTAGPGADDDAAGLCERLQAGGEVRRLADHRLLLGAAVADQVADHHEPGRDADPGLEPEVGPRRQRRDRLDQLEAGAHRPLGVALVGLRIAEVGEHAVAHVLGEMALEALDHRGAAALIGGDHRPHVLGVEHRRERGRVDQVAEQDGELAALALAPRRDPPPVSRPARRRHRARRRGACRSGCKTQHRRDCRGCSPGSAGSAPRRSGRRSDPQWRARHRSGSPSGHTMLFASSRPRGRRAGKMAACRHPVES